ncbi:hypothetical protein GEMRC1_012794 [Eukaryota sp. GEM-RC1]
MSLTSTSPNTLSTLQSNTPVSMIKPLSLMVSPFLSLSQSLLSTLSTSSLFGLWSLEIALRTLWTSRICPYHPSLSPPSSLPSLVTPLTSLLLTSMTSSTWLLTSNVLILKLLLWRFTLQK